MATTKITDLTAYTDPVNTDVLPIVDVTSDVTKKVSIANVMKNASQGTAAAPGIAFDGDSNTGIYSPGANQVAITTDGTQRLLIDSAGAVTIAGDLTVNGTTTNINTQNLIVEDKNVVLGDVAVPTDVTADGGGITLKGTTDKTINWVDSTDAWTSSERFSYPTGSAAAPTLTFTGDPNTGIYSPGADQVAISTNGTGRLFVSSTGQIGIGGAPSGSSLNIIDPVPIIRLTDSDTSGYSHVLQSDTSLYLDADRGAAGTGALIVRTNGTNERLRITSAGLVGVGTSSPNTALDVNGTINVRTNGYEFGRVTTNNVSATTGGLNFQYNNAGTFTNGMVLDGAGRVGIGITSPSLKFVVSNSGAAGLEIDPTATASAPLILSYNRSGAAYTRLTYDALEHVFFKSGSEAARIDSSGRLGIGSSNPLSTLDLAGTKNIGSDVGQIVVRDTASFATGVGGSILFAGKYRNTGDYVGTGYINTKKDNATDGNYAFSMGFGTIANGGTLSEKMTLTSGGSLGIGTTAPAQKLEVQDGSISVGSSVNASTTNVLLAGYGYILSGTKYGNTSIRSTYSNSDNSASLEFYVASGSTSTNERMRLDTLGRLLVGTSSGSDNNALLKVQGNAGGSTGAGWLEIRRGITTPSSGGQLALLSFADASGNQYASIEAYVDSTPGTNDYPGRLVFLTTADGASSPTERMRIANNGESYITSTGLCLGLSSVAAAGTTTPFIDGRYGATAGTPASGTQSFRVWTNGNVQNTNNSYTAISDIKLKENIVDANSQWADLKALRVRNYNLKEGQTHRQIGLIAQEVEPISPGLVYESPDRDEDGNDLGTVTKSVNYSVLYMKAVKALQEAMERIEVLEQRLSDAGIA